MPLDEIDLAFADFGGPKSGAKPLYPTPGSEDVPRTTTLPVQFTEGEQDFWSARRGSNPRPSAWEKKMNPREINDLRSNDRHIAA